MNWQSATFIEVPIVDCPFLPYAVMKTVFFFDSASSFIGETNHLIRIQTRNQAKFYPAIHKYDSDITCLDSIQKI